MSDVENLLCIPTSKFEMLSGLRRGQWLLKPGELENFFGFVEVHPRNANLEGNENIQQLVVYIAVRCEGQYLYYSRKKAQESETRLNPFLSIGFGGHVNVEDGSESGTLTDIVRCAAIRELYEELPELEEITFEISEPLALIRDVSNAVGRVHLGVFFVCDTPLPLSRFSEASVADLREMSTKLESWSNIATSILETIDADTRTK